MMRTHKVAGAKVRISFWKRGANSSFENAINKKMPDRIIVGEVYEINTFLYVSKPRSVNAIFHKNVINTIRKNKPNALRLRILAVTLYLWM